MIPFFFHVTGISITEILVLHISFLTIIRIGIFCNNYLQFCFVWRFMFSSLFIFFFSIMVSKTISISYGVHVVYNMMGAISGAGTAYPFRNTCVHHNSCVHVAQSLVFCVVFCISLFVFFSIFSWPLYCLSISEFRLLLNPFGFLEYLFQ
jgi:hypothetical protein